jgi:hypothetical protein
MPSAAIMRPVRARQPLSEHGSWHPLRLSSCRNHGTTRFQLAPVWSPKSAGTTFERGIRFDRLHGGVRKAFVNRRSAL